MYKMVPTFQNVNFEIGLAPGSKEKPWLVL